MEAVGAEGSNVSLYTNLMSGIFFFSASEVCMKLRRFTISASWPASPVRNSITETYQRTMRIPIAMSGWYLAKSNSSDSSIGGCKPRTY